MNILFISTENPYPPDHGHHIRTYNILRYLAKRHSVYFLSFIKNEGELRYLAEIEKFCKSADVCILPDEISKWRFYLSILSNFFSPLPYVAEKYYQRSMKEKIRQVVERNGIDIVHFDMLPLARYRKEAKTIPTILVEHNVESLRVKRLTENSRNTLFKLFMYYQYIKLSAFEKKEVSRFDLCTAVSDEDVNILKKMSSKAKIIVIPNGVDTSYFAPKGENRIERSMIWVGSMADVYNREAMEFFCSEIFPLIQAEIPDVELTVVGKSPPKRLLDLEKGNKNVKVVGYVNDVRPYIDAAAVYVAPMKSGSGTKLKVLNALSMAKAVVTTSIGAEGIHVKDNEHLLIADDPVLFAKKTIELLRDPERAAKIGENGRRRMCDEYDWESIGQRMDEVYHGLVRSKIGKR